eukprot:NODE_3085_length_1053_cov_29.028884_g2833_i0.p1 GENE.NODE_3085_length_1053_cov_29.028884_g2833_i0~~NODE_3085_length_1053_cov_29.028884_g2833_i0.p1  ORF type:complete len:295 (+),score=54.15 NODE_3085_length_1053_cov_29.028884_g2833_i0:77-961(+)
MASAFEKLKNGDLLVADRSQALHELKSDTTLTPSEKTRLLAEAFETTSSVLLQHEICYAIGQAGNAESLAILCNIMHNEKLHPVVRHEAGEAIGALGEQSSMQELQKYLDRTQGPIELCETAELAHRRLQWLQSNEFVPPSSFNSIDPAPASSSMDLSLLRSSLLNPELDLWDRYRALFALRNLNTKESAEILCEGFLDKTSALFRHEVAFVLGQMEQPISSGALSDVVANPSEHPMVRHEAAEALGALGDAAAIEVLRKFSTDSEPLVAESCCVGLKIHDYWSKWQTPVEVSA